MRRIVILEDDVTVQKHLCRIIEDMHRNVEVFCVESLKEAYLTAMEQQIHLFLVDIILEPSNPGDISGMRFVQEIRGVKRYRHVPVIFITSLQDPKMYSFSRLKCYDFIEKPFDEKLVRENIAGALEVPLASEQRRYVYFRKDGITYSVNPEEIYYIDISRRKVTVHCESGELEIPYKTCSDILKELGSREFVQCSRFQIVNKRYIEQIDYTRRLLKLKHVKEPVEIGRMLLSKFRDEMKE